MARYDDLDRPPLRREALARGLVTGGGLWREVRVEEVTASTNADVRAAALAGEPEGLVVVAESQTAGRGRLDRAWRAPPRSGLTLSVLLRPDVPASRWGWLPLLAGVAVATVVRRHAGVPALLKWPNDVVVGEEGRKLAGVLVERVDDVVPAAVVGVGLNVTLRAEELPAPGATSLLLEGAEATDRDPLVRAVLRELAGLYGEWRVRDGDAESSGLRAAYLELCATVGRRVRAELPGGAAVEGLAAGVDREGRLLVQGDVGEEVVVGAGDVVHLRPAAAPGNGHAGGEGGDVAR